MEGNDPLIDLYMRLVREPSPPGEERRVADVARAALESVGLVVDEDDAGAVIGGSAGNLYCRIPPTCEGTPIFFCAHLDTVPPTATLEPVIRDGVVLNGSPGILGADNKAALAVMLFLSRELATVPRGHAGVELVLTVAEEAGLKGAKAFDCGRLRAEVGFVFDHPGPIGAIVVRAPTRTTVSVDVRGLAAHAGLVPETGVNAIRVAAEAIAELEVGRLPDGSTVNVGAIDGGGALNIVPDRCAVGIELRSLDDETHRRLIDRLVDTFERSARRGGAHASFSISEQYHGYDVPEQDPARRMAQSALASTCFDPRPVESGGGADANVLRANGKSCVTLSHGVHDFHAPTERVSIADLHRMVEVAASIVREAADAAQHGSTSTPR